MRNLLIVLAVLLTPAITAAEAPAAGDLLSEEESIQMCAEALPKHLECKQESCTALVTIRTKGAKNVDLKALVAKCQEELTVDGSGDIAARKARCATWAKSRPMSMTRTEAKEIQACWAKPTCQARLDCWAPKMAKKMEAAAKKK